MSGPLVMTFTTQGPGGVPGMLRSQAAVSDVVSVPARTALAIARQIEAREALYLVTLDLRERADEAARMAMVWCGVAVALAVAPLLQAVLA